MKFGYNVNANNFDSVLRAEEIFDSTQIPKISKLTFYHGDWTMRQMSQVIGMDVEYKRNKMRYSESYLTTTMGEDQYKTTVIELADDEYITELVAAGEFSLERLYITTTEGRYFKVGGDHSMDTNLGINEEGSVSNAVIGFSGSTGEKLSQFRVKYVNLDDFSASQREEFLHVNTDPEQSVTATKKESSILGRPVSDDIFDFFA